MKSPHSSRGRFVWWLIRCACAAAAAAETAFSSSFVGPQHHDAARISRRLRDHRPSSYGVARSSCQQLEHSFQRAGPADTSALFRVSYDGRHFTGWSSANDDRINGGGSTIVSREPIKPSSSRGRRRRNHPSELYPSGHVRSVQGELRRCLSKLYGNADNVVVEGCSRTDRGVHACGLVAQVYCPKEADQGVTDFTSSRSKIPCNRTDPDFLPLPGASLNQLLYTINRMLPADVRVVGIARVPTLSDGGVFHPTLSSLYKTYCYRVSTDPISDALERRHVWQIGGGKNALDLESVHRACNALEGRHDFRAFQGAPRGSDSRNPNTVCTLHSVACVQSPSEHNQFEFRVTGDRFVYKMVRFLVGALVAVGRRRLTVPELEEAIQGCVRPREWECAPSHGLALEHVQYDADIDWISDPREGEGN